MNNSNNSIGNNQNELRKAAMWDEIVEVVKMMPCFSEEMSPDHFDYTLGEFYDVLYEQPANLDQRLESMFVKQFNTSPVVISVVNKILQSPKNTSLMTPLLKPLFKGSSNMNIMQLAPSFRKYLGTSSYTQLKSELLNKFMGTKVFQDAFKKLSLIKLKNKNVVIKTTEPVLSSNNATVAPPSFQEGNMFPLEEGNPTPVEGGAKRKKRQKMRELLKAKTVEQLRRLMRKAGKKCSRKGVSLRKSQMISALMRS